MRVAVLPRLLDQFWELLAPPRCAACGEPSPSHQLFCADCRAPRSFGLRGSLLGLPLTVAGVYEPPLSLAIARFKYTGHAELAAPLSRLLLPALSRLELAPDTVFVPIPLHPRRLAERGYNQSALLARELSRQLGRRVRPRLLQRTRHTEHQVGQLREARAQNVDSAFRLRQAGVKRAVLVDDVITTGATVHACAKALRAGGITVEEVVALARAGRPRA